MYRQYYCGCVYSKRDRDMEIGAVQVPKDADGCANGNIRGAVLPQQPIKNEIEKWGNHYGSIMGRTIYKGDGCAGVSV